jgi:DNA-binding transcriptional MerR regulator
MRSIRAVSLLTGIKTSTLRSWETRYGVPSPARSDGGRRLYSDADIERLVLIAALIEKGDSIGDLASLSGPALKARSQSFEPPSASRVLLDRLKAALAASDIPQLRRLLGTSLGSHAPTEAVSEILHPFLVHLGEEWAAGRTPVFLEHAVSCLIKKSVYNHASHFDWSASGDPYLFATLEGELHEFGVLFGWLVALTVGCNAIYLGPNLPADEICNAAKIFKARAIVLSSIIAGGAVADAAQILQSAPPETNLWIGAPTAHPIHAHNGAHRNSTFSSYTDFASALSSALRRGAIGSFSRPPEIGVCVTFN